MKKAFTLVEIMIVISIIALLGAIAVPNLYRANCIKDCNKGECSDKCKQYLNSSTNDNILSKYDMQDVEVFCSILGVSTYDFSRSQSLRVYYEQFKKGELNLKLNK